MRWRPPLLQTPIFDNLTLLMGAELLMLLSGMAARVVVTPPARWASQFLRQNLPIDEELIRLRSEWGRPPKRVQRRFKLTPNRGPVLLTVAGLVLFFPLSVLVASSLPRAVEDARRRETRVAEGTAATPQGLPKEGDFVATCISGLSAKDYLYQRIADSNAYIVEGYQAGSMQQNYAATGPSSDTATSHSTWP